MTMSPAVAKLAAVLLLFLFVGAAVLAMAPVARYSAGLDEERAKLLDWLQRYQRVRAGNAALNDRLAELGQIREAQQNAYLAGDTPALAAVALQERVTRVVNDVGAELTSTRILPEQAQDALTEIGIQVELKTDIVALRSILLEIETGRPRLFIDALDVTRTTAMDMIYLEDPTATVESPTLLNIRMRVSGYKRNAEPERGAATSGGSS
jgi:hypothetical protein